MPWGSARSERSQFLSSPCPFTPGVGVSGVYFSFASGKWWTQPTYTGYTARGCKADFITPVSVCVQTEGSIGTLPWYKESGLCQTAIRCGVRPCSWASRFQLEQRRSALLRELPDGWGLTTELADLRLLGWFWGAIPVVSGLISRRFQVVVVSLPRMSSAARREISSISVTVRRSSRWLLIHSA